MKPTFVEINNTKYEINIDFRVALECEKIANDENIGNYERALAIIYKLFGEKGLHDNENHDKLLDLAVRYLQCDKDSSPNDEEPNMDYEQDMDYIEASFRSDYLIDLENTKMHWWTFSNLMNGLTENCVLNRVRYVRDYDIQNIKDPKERQKWIDQKEKVALRKKQKPLTLKEQESLNAFYELTGIREE